MVTLAVINERGEIVATMPLPPDLHLDKPLARIWLVEEIQRYIELAKETVNDYPD